MPVNSRHYPSWGDTVYQYSRIEKGKETTGRIVDIDEDTDAVTVLFSDGEAVEFHKLDFVGAFVGYGGGRWDLE